MGKQPEKTKADQLERALGKYMQYRTPEEHMLIQEAAGMWLGEIRKLEKKKEWS